MEKLKEQTLFLTLELNKLKVELQKAVQKKKDKINSQSGDEDDEEDLDAFFDVAK